MHAFFLLHSFPNSSRSGPVVIFIICFLHSTVVNNIPNCLDVLVEALLLMLLQLRQLLFADAAAAAAVADDWRLPRHALGNATREG